MIAGDLIPVFRAIRCRPCVEAVAAYLILDGQTTKLSVDIAMIAAGPDLAEVCPPPVREAG